MIDYEKYISIYVCIQTNYIIYIYICISYISCMPHSIPLVISHWYHVLNKPSLKNHKTNHTGKLHHFIASSRLADYHRVLPHTHPQ